MNRYELVEALKKVLKQWEKDHDTERAHGTADDLLLEHLDDEKIKAAYDAIPKWYA